MVTTQSKYKQWILLSFILLLPLLSFLLIGVVDLDITKTGKVWSHKAAGLIGTISLALVTILSYTTAYQYFFATERLADGTFPTIVPFNFTWLPLGSLHFDLGVLLDPISVMMLVVISTVSLMVHLYSFGYMHGERGFQRYYAYLSLFTMSMLGLVLATNIFQMYLFWELVGVSSYLLIGFYYTSPAAIAASKKAFIVTRFADMFFLGGHPHLWIFCTHVQLLTSVRTSNMELEPQPSFPLPSARKLPLLVSSSPLPWC